MGHQSQWDPSVAAIELLLGHISSSAEQRVQHEACCGALVQASRQSACDTVVKKGSGQRLAQKRGVQQPDVCQLSAAERPLDKPCLEQTVADATFP